jgi:hypothetical protein
MADYRSAVVRDGWIAAILGGVYLALYTLTLCPIVFWYDSAEFVTAAVTLGIPHPPGYPLYTLIGHAFTWLPLDPALAVNLMSATFAALSVAFTYLVCRCLGVCRSPAIVGAATLGGGKLFWTNAVVAEVYCPGLAFVVVVLYLLLRSRQESRFGLTILAAFLAGLGLGVHMSIATLGIGFGLLVWAYDVPVTDTADLRHLLRRSGLGNRVSRSLVVGAFAALGSLVFLYLPLRAAQRPALNFGDPSNLQRFKWVITGGAYKHWFRDDLDTFTRLGSIAVSFREQLLLVGAVLAVAGMFWLWRRRPLECLSLVLMAAGNIAFFFRYQVHDLAVFFLPTTLLLCCFVAAGAQALGDTIGKVVTVHRRRGMRRLTNGALLAFAAALALGNYRSVDMSGFTETDEYVEAMVRLLPKDSVLLNFTTPPEWKLDAVFGMYVQKVLLQRTDVDVVVPRGPAAISAALASGRPVYAYVPIAGLAKGYQLAPEGPVFRVLGPLPTPR